MPKGHDPEIWADNFVHEEDNDEFLIPDGMQSLLIRLFAQSHRELLDWTFF